jgi:hypothetical protein
VIQKDSENPLESNESQRASDRNKVSVSPKKRSRNNSKIESETSA